jgi:hypothetical protein
MRELVELKDGVAVTHTRTIACEFKRDLGNVNASVGKLLAKLSPQDLQHVAITPGNDGYYINIAGFILMNPYIQGEVSTHVKFYLAYCNANTEFKLTLGELSDDLGNLSGSATALGEKLPKSAKGALLEAIQHLQADIASALDGIKAVQGAMPR